MDEQAAHELYSRWVNPGDLVFDIGAHTGEHTSVFLGMGARVVAVEPQHGLVVSDQPGVVVARCAIGSRIERVPFYECDGDRTYMATASHDYLNKIQAHGEHHYRETRLVPMIRLDDLISMHGTPAFCKIDVEGGEADVLRGLSRPLPALSFEVHDFDPLKAETCYGLLQRLSPRYRYAYSRRESFVLEPVPDDPGGLDMFGDIYAWIA